MGTPLLPYLGSQTYVMGILNLTRDSFSGDGLLQDLHPVEATLLKAHTFVKDGAHILDLGAESTRPGATPISAQEEMDRLLPVIEQLKWELPETLLSVDTYKASVAKSCLEAGAHIINDVWGFRADAMMAKVVSQYNATVILMHNRSTFGQFQFSAELGGRYVDVAYENLVEQVKQDLLVSVGLGIDAGVCKKNIILDPGIGFGKTREQNLFLLKYLDQIHELGYPVLLGVSRKSFIGFTLDLPPTERLEGSLAANAYGILNGADIVRVHDVKETSRMVRMLDAIRNA